MRLTQVVLRYDMYDGEDRAPSVAHQRDDVDGASPPEPGPAIEVIELANGETVWYVVG
jgi:serine/arginine repetitive matrix protein 2